MAATVPSTASLSPEVAALIERAPDWLGPWLAHPIAGPGLGIVTVIGGALLLHLLTQRLILRLAQALVRRTSTDWDDLLFEAGVFRRLAWLIPILLIHAGTPLIPLLEPALIEFVQRLARATMVLVVLLALMGLLSGINTIYSRYDIARGHPIKGYLQALAIIAWIFGGILIIATLARQSPWFFLSGLGAMTAILLLIFRDTLLGLVAGVQLTTNKLVQVGDWIEMPQFGADGEVIDISLHQVKVQNWDRTVSVVPTHKFLDHSFRNWRSMFESGGRRIMRAVNIDMRTIRFLDADEIERFTRFEVLRDYMLAKRDELDEWNRAHCSDPEIVANARHLTNIGTFRAYLIGYLRRHPQIRQDMVFLVRQLAPTAQGLPIQIYVFTNDTRWAVYEGIQADIFDHVLAVLPEFGLRVFQEPSGADFARLGSHREAPARLPQRAQAPLARPADGR